MHMILLVDDPAGPLRDDRSHPEMDPGLQAESFSVESESPAAAGDQATKAVEGHSSMTDF